ETTLARNVRRLFSFGATLHSCAPSYTEWLNGNGYTPSLRCRPREYTGNRGGTDGSLRNRPSAESRQATPAYSRRSGGLKQAYLVDLRRIVCVDVLRYTYAYQER